MLENLLYGMAKRNWNPLVFTAEFLQHLQVDTAKAWLTAPALSGHKAHHQGDHRISFVTALGPATRARLLRDCAQGLLQSYNGQALNIVEKAKGYLIKDDGSGFLQLLQPFRAYSDPLHKKSYLLAKALERRGIFHIEDAENLSVPVDNLLVRIALRCGLVEVVETNLALKLRRNLKAAQQEEFEVRSATMHAYRIVSEGSQLRATFLDDILWTYGRNYCHSRMPSCERPSKCPFAEECRSTYDPDYA